jgi:hypothetical protein
MPPNRQRVKLILTYDISPDVQDSYFQFMLGELVPAVQSQGLHMNGAWHTAYGQYPKRLVEFIGDDQEAVEALLDTPLWEELEQRLHGYVTNYAKKVVRLRDNQFQF